MQELIKFTDVKKSYGSTVALSNINLAIEQGKIIGLLGPNGSGKTTLIKLANGLLQPTEGTVLINGYLPGIQTKKIISYLPENTYLNDWMRVGDIIEFFKDFYSDFNQEKSFDMLRSLGIKNPVKRNKGKAAACTCYVKEFAAVPP